MTKYMIALVIVIAAVVLATECWACTVTLVCGDYGCETVMICPFD